MRILQKKSRRGINLRNSSAQNSVTFIADCVNPDNNGTIGSGPASVPSNELCETEDVPELEIEKIRLTGQYDPNVTKITGRRIVDIQHFLTAVRRLERHECRINKLGYFAFDTEKMEGLNSILKFKCKFCNETRTIYTNPQKVNQENINYCVTSSVISNGTGFANVELTLSMLDIPGFSKNTYSKYQQAVGENWFGSLSNSLIEAGKEEYNLALNEGRNTGDIGLIEVIVDGGWSHRSYGHRYSSKSGVAVIIGSRTNKILFMAIRNKYCSICAIASHANAEVKEHKCYKNWDKSSTAMEADIITEGFCQSESMHNLRYTSFIGDGDSNTESKILAEVPYSRDIKKVECANHLTKNVAKHLYTMANECAVKKKLLTPTRINTIKKTARKMIAIHSKRTPPLSSALKADLLNVVPHVYGNHKKCTKEYCMKVGSYEEGNQFDNCDTDTRARICQIMGRFASKSDSLIRNVTSNKAEQVMRQVARLNGGKQGFFGRRNGFNIRCYGAGLAYQYGPEWIIKCTKGLSHSQRLKRLVESRTHLNRLSARRRPKYYDVMSNEEKKKEKYYGKHCMKPDLPLNEVAELVSKQKEILQVNAQQQKAIERKTRGQSSNPMWFQERKLRITASTFGDICSRRAHHGNLVHQILYCRIPFLPSIEWGKIHEGVAVKKYEAETGTRVEGCGLFVCDKPGMGFLAASPDGLVGCHKIIEVKCPYSARNYTPVEAARNLKNFCCAINEDDKLVLKRNHKYFCQVQGQMYVTGRKECDFIIYTLEGLNIETIFYDEAYFQPKIIKLIDFYDNNYGVELIDSRHQRSLPIRNSK